jgi:hypothetical protein
LTLAPLEGLKRKRPVLNLPLMRRNDRRAFLLKNSSIQCAARVVSPLETNANEGN